MDSQTREFVRHKENEANKLNYRFYNEEDSRTSETRTEFMRDYARVLYSSSFRRLQGKMQLLGVNETTFNRNRLTHSLEVSQIARGLAIQLRIKNTEVVETCSLIHDIGNPPFGHSGEVTLNLLADESGGYEGNAQAFRVVRELEKKHPSFNGLNLTLRTLWGITKYFYSRDQNPKKFLYSEDYSFLLENLDRHGLAKQKSIDMQIMDLSDEIAYAAHDLEDALSSGLIVIGELVYEFKISGEFSDSYEVFKNIVKSTQRYAQKTGSLGSSEEYSMVFRKELTSKIVSALMKDVGLVCKDGTQQIGYKQLGNLALGLKKLVFKTVLRKNHIQEYEMRGNKVIKGLFRVYDDAELNRDLILLPPELRARGDKECRKRLVCDYISGMMDSYAAQEYMKYYGESSYNKLI